ncbi:MAG: hypothetical protein K8S27_13370 [Candidatus Omnitrophica bacterium]|nr:hypothetical protein [Candidatus Omnitrophota bacterium]
MNPPVISSEALSELRYIHKLSLEYNKTVQVGHQERLLDLMRHHVDEIQELLSREDKHGLVETGDLLILCFELLLEHDASIDDILRQCFDRYKKKLTSLMDESDFKQGSILDA